MNGWLSVLFVTAMLLAGVSVAVRKAARHWWDYVAVAAIALLFARPLFDVVGGDVSRYLPWWLWSDGADGKDQVIVASIATTLLLPPICAAAVWLVVRRI